MALWKNGIAGVNWNWEAFKIDPATGVRSSMNVGLSSTHLYSLFNVGDSLFALNDNNDHLFKCEAGSERWIPVWANAGYKPSNFGFSPFGITRLTGDSLFLSRDYGATWQPLPAPRNSWAKTLGIVPLMSEGNRLWAPTNPIQRWEPGPSAWVADVAGMPKVTPSDLASDGKRLFAYDETWLQSPAPDSSWKTESEADGTSGQLFTFGHSMILWYGNGTMDTLLRIDPDGRRTGYSVDMIGAIQKIFAGTRDRIYVSSNPVPGYYSGGFQVATPGARMWTGLRPGGTGGPMDWFAMDGDRIVTGAAGPPYYSPDGGNTWDTCPMPGNPSVNGMVSTGDGFLGFTSDGLYRSADPPSGWKTAAFQGDKIEMLTFNGDTVVAEDTSRLLLTVDGGRIWSRVESPFAPKAIKRAALAWGSICLIDSGKTDSLGILCGSLSALATQQVVGLHPVSSREGELPSLRLRWGRIEGALPGRRGPVVSAGVDGRIRPFAPLR